MGMDVGWPYKRRELGDEIVYNCPSKKLTEENESVQLVRCIWHRQTDTMHWWPQNLHECTRKYLFQTGNILTFSVVSYTHSNPGF